MLNKIHYLLSASTFVQSNLYNCRYNFFVDFNDWFRCKILRNIRYLQLRFNKVNLM